MSRQTQFIYFHLIRGIVECLHGKQYTTILGYLHLSQNCFKDQQPIQNDPGNLSWDILQNVITFFKQIITGKIILQTHSNRLLHINSFWNARGKIKSLYAYCLSDKKNKFSPMKFLEILSLIDM